MDYSNFQDWEINELAKRNGQTADEWKAEQDALAGKETVPEATTPPTEPEKKKKKDAAAGESSSAGTSLESPETEPIEPEVSLDELEDIVKNEPYIINWAGVKIYKDDYESTGMRFFFPEDEDLYPSSFFDFAEQRGYTLRYDDPRPEMIAEADEIFGEDGGAVAEAKKKPMSKGTLKYVATQRKAKRYLKAIERENEHTNREQIVKEYFGLEETDDESPDGVFRRSLIPYRFPDYYSDNGLIHYTVVPGPPATEKEKSFEEERREALNMGDLAFGMEWGPTGFSQQTGAKYIQEKTITVGDFLGPKRYAEWLELTGGSDNRVYSGVMKGFNLDLVTDGTKERIVNESKTRAAEAFTRNLGREQTKRLFAFMETEGTVFPDLIRAEAVKRMRDERDWEKGPGLGRKLYKTETYGGRTYVPSRINLRGKWGDFGDFLKNITAAEEDENWGEQYQEAWKVFEGDLNVIGANFELWEEQYQYMEALRGQYNSRLDEIQSTIDKFVVNGKVVLNSQEEADVFNQAKKQYDNLIKEKAFVEYDQNYKQLAAIQKELNARLDKLNEAAPLFNDISYANDAIMKNYSLYHRAEQAMSEFFLGGGYQAFAETMNALSYLSVVFGGDEDNSWRQWGESLVESSTNYNEELQEKREKTLPLALRFKDIDRYGVSFWDYGGELLAENTPTLVISGATLGYGAVAGTGATAIQAVSNASKLTTIAFGVGEGGNYLVQTALAKKNAPQNIKDIEARQAELELLGYTGVMDQMEFDEALEFERNNLNLSGLKRGFGAATYAGTAMFWERYSTMGIVKNAQKMNRSIGYKYLSTRMRPSLALPVSKSLAIPKLVLTSSAINIYEETMTLWSQNLFDIAVAGQNKSINDGLDIDFFLGTGFTATALAGPAIGQNIYSAVSHPFISLKNRKQQDVYTKELMAIQEELNSDKLSPERRKDLRNKRYAVLTSMNLYNADILLKLPDMEKKDVQALISIDRDLMAIYNEANKIGQEGEVGNYGKQQLEQLRKQSEELNSKKEELLGKSEEEIAEKYKDASNPAQAAFNHGLFRRSVRLAEANSKFNLSEIRTMDDLKAFFDANPNMKPKNKKAITNAFLGQTTNALEVDGKIIVFSNIVEAQIMTDDGLEATIAAVSPLHEIGHMKTRQSGVLSDPDIVEKADKIVEEARQALIERAEAGNLSDADLEIALKRLDYYNKKEKKGVVRVDEAFQLIGDLINTGAIDANYFTSLYNFKTFALKTVNKLFGPNSWTMQLNSGADIFNFASSWTKRIAEGEIIVRPEKEKETDVKESAARGDLLQTINSLVPETVQTQADFFDRKVFNPIYNDGNLHPAITNYIRNKAVSPEEAQKIIESVADRLINFNPEAKRKSGEGKITLGEFIFSNVNFGQRDARKALFEESQERAQLESTDSEQARQIATEESVTTKQVEAPKYKTLIERRVVEPTVVNTIKDKIKSTVRVMKTRMDKPVSKNVTVKPYIAEIKKTMGKQADIDIKKAMGGLKDNELRKFLLKNKAAMLENMTTTYLMTAMPNAVQKKVDGQWTSDWKGKKIDRETVGTDNAGRTSGAELVRRLPKAATRLSDAEFLSNFFNEDGSLIRGRKESLAKAVAEEISFDILTQELQNPDSEIRKAFEGRQEMLEAALADNFVTQFIIDAERGNVKFSISGRQINELRKHQSELLETLEGLGTKITESRFRNALTSVYIDNNETSLTPELIKKIAKLGVNSIDLYIRKKEDIGSAELAEFLANGIQQKLADNNLLDALGLTVDDIFGGYKALGNEELNIEKNRAATLDYTSQYVEQNGIEGLIRILKWFGGHTYSSSKIGGGRGQYYAGKTDFYNNNIALIPGVTIDGGKVFYKGELVEVPSTAKQGAYKTVNKQKVPKTEQDFANEYEKRKEESHEAWELLVDYLGFIRAQNDPILWVATMKSLDSNMETILKAAANVEYYHTGGKNIKNVRYEHLIPTNYIIMQLTSHFWNKKIDLSLLEEKYVVAIVPQNMDENINLQFQSVMPLKWNYKKDAPHQRYYNLATFGMDFMVPIKKIGGDNAGTVYGEQWAAFNSLAGNNASFELSTAMEIMEPSVNFSRAVPRAVFMVGGPGAGKTNVGKGLKLGRRGFKVVNQDLALEPMKAEAGLPANEQQYTKEQRSMRAKLGAAARKAAEAKMAKYMGFGESMVVDGTGASYNATMKKINALRKAGYDVSIVFANTSKEEAIARNKARAERALPDNIVERTWDAVQESAKLYKQEFGDKFYEVNTNELKLGQDLPAKFLNKLYEDLDVDGIRYSAALSKKFNQIIERKTGVDAVKNFSRIQAQMRGRNKGRFKFFIAPGADDFRGLVHYAFAGKGKQGEADMAWFEEKLMTPYFKGVSAIDAMRQQIKRDFRVVTKQFKQEYKMLKKKIGEGMFTYDHALRVYMWDRQGLEVEGLSKRDKKLLLDAIAKNPELVSLADALLVVARREQWPDPAAHWEAGSVLSDLNGMTEKIGRKKFLQEFIENAEVIFSEENLNKIEAIYGRRHREALEDSLYAMKNGTNRPTGSNRQVNAWLNWINGSTGAIMFFNRRSALLQMLSFTNFINWSDNNMVKAAAAFANQKQYWSDWTMIFNSDKLKERRGGLKQDVSESEIAAVAGQSKNSPKAILAYLLKIGFTPTQIADSMAIATGGAMFYRNRVNTYLKQGMDQKAAEEQAFLDFSMKSDEAQQSSDPALVSQQQRSVLGRLILAFANTPMQYTRLMKKAGQDLINGRGRPIENISKIAYYGVIQNFIFSALQSALFAMAFDDDDDEELSEAEVERKAAKEEQKTTRVINSMLDTVLRGSGVYGAVASTMKNAIMEYYKQEEKGFMGDHTYTLLAAAGISPPIQSKFRKIYSAIQTSRFEKDNVEARGWALTADGRLNLGPNWSIFGNVLSGVTNVPLDRVVDELKSVSEALDERNQAWQRIALALGWKTWDVGVRNEEADLIKQEAKEARKQEGIRKAKETRRINTEAKKKKEAEDAQAAFEAWEKEFVKKQRKNQEN